MIGLEDRQEHARNIEAACKAGARLHQACKIVGLAARMLQRWKAQEGLVSGDGRPDVGVTPLVAPDADAFHGSGTLGHIEAGGAILCSEIYRRCLPFGAVPVLSLVATGTRCAPRHVHEASSPAPLRSLLYRPFVPRPAHFMRNARHAEAGRAATPPPDEPTMPCEYARPWQGWQPTFMPSCS